MMKVGSSAVSFVHLADSEESCVSLLVQEQNFNLRLPGFVILGKRTEASILKF